MACYTVVQSVEVEHSCYTVVQTVEVEQSWAGCVSVHLLFPLSVLSGHSVTGEYMHEYTESML